MIPDDVFNEYIEELQVLWTPESYSLFENNCNHFSEEVATFLTGTGIPVSIPHVSSQTGINPLLI